MLLGTLPWKHPMFCLLSSRVTDDQQKKIDSVLQQNKLISKPSCPNDKAVQTGRHLSVTRSRPDFCILSGIRHSTLACPSLDPVDDVHPIPSSHNPEDQQKRSNVLLPTSRLKRKFTMKLGGGTTLGSAD